MLLKDFFAYAMRKYQLPCNPTVDTTRPEVITPEMRVLSPSEMQVFIEEVMRETQRVAILTTLFVGFRVGEMLALKIAETWLETPFAGGRHLRRVEKMMSYEGK